MLSNSIFLLCYKKIYCNVYWEQGAEFNLSRQTWAFSFLSCFHMGSRCVWELALKSVWCNTWLHIPPCFKTTVLLCPPAHWDRATLPLWSTGDGSTKPWLIGIMKTCWCACWLSALESRWSFEVRREQFGHHVVMNPYLSGLCSGLLGLWSCSKCVFSVQSLTSCTLVLFRGRDLLGCPI